MPNRQAVFTDNRKLQFLSESEKAIFDYVMNHPQDVLKMNVREFAKAVYTSPSAVIRFCQKLDYDGFNEFKLSLAEEAQGKNSLVFMDSDFPDLNEKTVKEIANIVSDFEIRAIKETARQINSTVIEKVIEEMEKASGISLYAFGFSGNSAQNFESVLRRAGYRVTHESDLSRMTTWASVCDQNEFSILISYSGSNLKEVYDILKRRKMKFASITSKKESELNRVSTYQLYVPVIERTDEFFRIAPFSSKTEIDYLLDVLYAALYSKHYKTNMEKMKEMKKKNLG